MQLTQEHEEIRRNLKRLIDPRDTRRVLALCLAVCDEAARRTLHPMQFGVARP